MGDPTAESSTDNSWPQAGFVHLKITSINNFDLRWKRRRRLDIYSVNCQLIIVAPTGRVNGGSISTGARVCSQTFKLFIRDIMAGATPSLSETAFFMRRSVGSGFHFHS